MLITATARWTAAELKDVLVWLSPVLGVVTGSFVTYFFTRQAAASATGAAREAADNAAKAADSVAKAADTTQAELLTRTGELQSQADRSRALHNALSVALGMVDERTARRMRADRTIASVLEQR